MRRLKIIDLNTGNQPIHNEDESLWIVFNGEIFNFIELREELEKKGHKFYTGTDTEVILHMYEEEGENCLEHFRGMFAFVIHDIRKNRLFLARDRLGIKPLFYCETDSRLFIASEMKAILAFPEVERDMNWKALDAYFTLSYIPAPMTIYKNIHKLNPGHYMVIEDGKITICKYWDLSFRPDYSLPEKYYGDKFLELFEESVRLRMVSDVPIGAFLSGGVDSSSVVAMMSRYHPAVETLSVGYGGAIGAYEDERKYARLVSNRYGTVHRECELDANLCSPELVETIVRAFDEPFADHGAIPTYFICKAARENMTVALSGLGGDELFSGYRRHLGFSIGELYRLLPATLRKTLLPLIEKLPESRGGETGINWLKRFARGGAFPRDRGYMSFINLLSRYSRHELFSPDLCNHIESECYEGDFLNFFNSDNASTPLDRVYYTDIKTYLPDDILALTDRISMAHALEVRVPFLDHKLVEFCASIPHYYKLRYFQQKHILRKAVGHLLPNEIFNHKKQGFVAPMNFWLNNQLRDYAGDMLLSGNSHMDFFRKDTISRVLDDHFHGRQLNTSLIWSLLIFRTWQQLYLFDK
jgi:asparagine synthase (glutamine-hydrolysing)